MNPHNFISIVMISLLIFISVSCKQQENLQDDTSENDSITLISKAHFNTEKMEWAKVEKHQFQELINTRGKIIIDPKSNASIYSPISGKINNIFVQVNQQVEKGQKLCVIESIEFVEIQKEYLESKALLLSKTADYNRIKGLYEKNISSQKDFVQIESEYLMLIAKMKGLKSQLSLLNVDFSSLENNEISLFLTINAPISGYINDVNINMDQYINSEKQLMGIIDIRGAQVQFPVYSKNLNQIETGQSLFVFNSENPKYKIASEIVSIGKVMGSELQAVNCIANLNVEKGNLILPGMRVQVEILTNEYEALAVKSSALIESDNKYYVLLKIGEQLDNYKLQKFKIKLGRKSTDYTEIIGLKSGEVLAKGSYYINIEN